MELSVVTISFNQAKYLEATLQSVIAQKGTGIEYIVIDAGSTDGSRDIIERYRHGIDRVIFEPDFGPPDGLNKGLSFSVGKYFYYLNSDDVVISGSFVEALSILKDEPEIDILYGNGYLVDDAGKITKRIVSSHKYTPFRYAHGAGMLLQQACFIRTERLREVGGFNIRNMTCWDGEAFLMLALRGARFRHSSSTWGNFRIHLSSITGGQKLNKEYIRDAARLRNIALGRDWMAADFVLVIAYRGEKFVREFVSLVSWHLSAILRIFDNRRVDFWGR